MNKNLANVHCKLIRFLGIVAPHREAAIRNRSLIYCHSALAICLTIGPSLAGATDLRPEATQGFDRYIRLTEKRLAAEVAPGGAFLWVDSNPDPSRSEMIARLKRGEVVSERLHTPDPSGDASTPGALIHHWVGTVFIPGASLRQVLDLVQDYDRHTEYYKPEVVKSKTLEHAGNDFKVYLRLRKKKIVTVVLDTEYAVHYHTVDATRAFSESYSTRIAEINHPDEPDERATPEGKGEGFMWRLNSYWRFAERDGGVYVQCEAISLTRDIPTGLNWLIAPFIESIPRESLEFTLLSTRSAVLGGSAHYGARKVD